MSPRRSQRPLLFRLLAALPLLTPAALAQGSVHVVDQAGGPGSDFTDLSQAVAAAASGDTVLVRSGDYDDLVSIDGKSLTVLAEAGADVDIWGFEVRNLAPTDFVVLRGIRPFGPGFVSLTIDACQGSVWCEEIDFVSILTAHMISGGINITDSASVAFSHCTLEGAIQLPNPGAPALDVRDTDAVHLFDCQVAGSAPSPGLSITESPAVRAENSFVYLQGSSVVGGHGIDGTFFSCAGDGGDGVLVADTLSSVQLHDSTVLAGLPGSNVGGTCPNPQAGTAISAPSGTVASVPGTARSLAFPSPVREGETAQASVRGLPGELTWLIYRETPSAGLFFGLFDGPLMLQPPTPDIFLGALDAAGAASPAFTLGQLPPGVELARLVLQTVHLDPGTGRLAFGAPSTLELLDSGI